jgi:hypothetical protein
MNRPAEDEDNCLKEYENREANRSEEEYENLNRRFRNPAFHLHPLEGVPAFASHQEATLAPRRYGMQPPPPSMLGLLNGQSHTAPMVANGDYFPPTGRSLDAFASRQEAILTPGRHGVQPPPPSMLDLLKGQSTTAPMAVNGVYFPPTGSALDAFASHLRAQQAEALRTLQDNRSRESLIYEQLGRAAAAAATANHLPAEFPGGIHAAPFQYQAAAHPQPSWWTNPSAAFLPMASSALSEEDIFHASVTAAAPGRSLQQHPSRLNFPLYQGSAAVATRAPAEEKVSREKRRQRSRIVDAFPIRLHRLLSEVESNGNEHIVSFTPSGRAFQVHKPHEFIQDVAPKYFRQKHFSSFTRQLNVYGFDKVKIGPDKGIFIFEHPAFQRGKPELCPGILARVPEDYRNGRVS